MSSPQYGGQINGVLAGDAGDGAVPLGTLERRIDTGWLPRRLGRAPDRRRTEGAYNQSSVVWHHRDTATRGTAPGASIGAENGRQTVQVQLGTAQVGRAASARKRRSVSRLRSLREREEPRRLHTSCVRRWPRLSPLHVRVAMPAPATSETPAARSSQSGTRGSSMSTSSPARGSQVAPRYPAGSNAMQLISIEYPGRSAPPVVRAGRRDLIHLG